MPDVDPVVIGAVSVRAEIAEAPDAHDLTPTQAARIDALSDSQINAAVRAQLDDSFWEVYDSIRSSAIAHLRRCPLVHIVTLNDEEYERAVDAANDEGGSVQAVAKHLAKWDYGDENDGAASVNGYTNLSDLEAGPHQIHTVDIGDLHYWLVIDHGLRFYALYRRPINV